jgi:tetratricopeptide (TPR) repeat protein
LLRDEKYAEAAKILEAFTAKGNSAENTGKTNGKGFYHPEVFFTLGNCYLLMEHYPQAAAAYRRAVAKDASHTAAWLNLGRSAYELSRLSEAGHCFARAYETAEKKKPEHLYYSALSYLMADDHEKSLKLFDRLLDEHPQAMKPEWKENLVHALLAAKQPRRALAYIRELADHYTGEKQQQWQEILLYQYIQLEMKQEALALARKLTREAPEVEKWWKALANIHLNEGRYEEALAALLTYNFLTPLNKQEKKLIADLSLELGIPIKAAPIYEDCLKTDPEKKLLRRLALAYRQLGRPEKALERIRAFAGTPGDADSDVDLLLLAAELHYALEQYEKAAAAYRRAARQKGDHSGRAWLMAGYAAWQIDNFDASRQAFDRAAGYKSQKKAAQKALRKLNSVMRNQ